MVRRGRAKFYVMSYDIPNDHRRTKVHKLMTGFGEWVQYSVFECFLTDKELVQLRSRLMKLIDPKEDKIRLYDLCESCVAGVEVIGGSKPKEKTVYVA